MIITIKESDIIQMKPEEQKINRRNEHNAFLSLH